MLTDLKNNKQRAREQGAADGALGRLQKWLKQLASKGGLHEPPPFKVSWDELVHADERGRWWLVGSAWAGRAPSGISGAGEDGGSASASARERGGAASGGGGVVSVEARLLRLAEGQRMNTEVRRQIFVAIMGADDYIDAHGRLTKLKLKRAQQPELVRVLLECCGQEGIFNRYYALLGARLCETFREVRFAMNFAFWDAFKQLGDFTLHRAANTAKLLAQLLCKGAVPVTALKVVKWHGLPERAIFFWQVFLIELLSAPAAEQRAAMVPLRDPEVSDLRDGLLVFIERHVRRMVSKQHAALSKPLQLLIDSLDTA